MDQTAEEKMVRERIRKKVNEVSSASQSLLSPVQDHINFTLQVRLFLSLSLKQKKKFLKILMSSF